MTAGPAAAKDEVVPKRWQDTLPGRLVRVLGRPAGLAAAALAPRVASYSAVLLAQTAVPAWNSGHAQLDAVRLIRGGWCPPPVGAVRWSDGRGGRMFDVSRWVARRACAWVAPAG